MVPPMDFLFILWFPKGSKKNWPKCQSGQSVSGQNVTLAKVSFWPKCNSAVHFKKTVNSWRKQRRVNFSSTKNLRKVWFSTDLSLVFGCQDGKQVPVITLVPIFGLAIDSEDSEASKKWPKIGVSEALFRQRAYNSKIRQNWPWKRHLAAKFSADSTKSVKLKVLMSNWSPCRNSSLPGG